MNDPQQHFVAHPYYLMGVAAERGRILEQIENYLDSLAQPSYSINSTTLREIIQGVTQ